MHSNLEPDVYRANILIKAEKHLIEQLAYHLQHNNYNNIKKISTCFSAVLISCVLILTSYVVI